MAPTLTVEEERKLLVKNTFLHIRNESEDDDEDTESPKRRSGSAPPALRSRQASWKLEADEPTDTETHCTQETLSITSSEPANSPTMVIPPSGHTKLNSAARMWQLPGFCRPCDDPNYQIRDYSTMMAMQHHLVQIAGVVETVKSMLIDECTLLTDATVQEDGLGWTLVARIRATGSEANQQWAQVEEVLTAAKAAIIAACNHSSSIYTVGYQGRPFAAVGANGFAAMVGGVSDERNACWGLLRYGSCRFYERCNWEHPLCTRRICVKVVLS